MIALVPAAGHATRIQKLPKFLLPVPGSYLLKRLCDQMAMLGAHIVIGTNSETYQQMCHYAPDGAVVYSVDSASMAETVRAAKTYIDLDQMIICAMPDSYWTDDTILQRLAASLLNDASAIVAAALWEIEPGQRFKFGMCEVTGAGGSLSVSTVIDKPQQTTLRRAWGVLAWRKAFWQYIQPGDGHMGMALQRAITAGEIVRAVYADGPYHDCGTQGDYFHLIRSLAEPEVVS